MRCKECNVDLGEEYTKCPLCGAAAVDEKPLLEGMKTAPYFKYDEKAILSRKKKYHCDFPQKYVFRIAVAVSAAFALAALCGADKLWNIGVPVLMTFCAVFYLISGCAEKGRLLHSAVGLLAVAAVFPVLIIASAIAKCGLAAMAMAFGACAVCFLLLFLIKPKKMVAQLRALFCL